MEQTFNKAEELIDSVKKYVNIRTEQIKLQTAEKTAKVLSALIAGAAAWFFIMVSIFFVFLAIAVITGKLLGGLEWGLLCTALLILILGSVIWLLRSRFLQYPLMNAILHHLLTEEDDEED